LDGPALRPEDTEGALRHILSQEQWDRFMDRGGLEFSYSASEMGRFRVSAYSQRGSVALAIRVIPHSIPQAEEIGLPQCVMDLAMGPKGLLVITGSDGSGKSTTAAAVIGVINAARDAHVISLEDPIEYLHRHDRSLVNQREIGVDVPSSRAALRSALRQDPDVIFLSHIRDADTARLALAAAETSSLVMCILSEVGVSAAIEFFLGILGSSQRDRVRVQLASVLRGVVYQELLPRMDIPGRVAAFEVLLATPAVRDLIRENRVHQVQSAIQTGARHGMVSLKASLQDLLSKGKISEEDYHFRARGLDHFESH
jgi:twitching motility protein PilT